VLTSRRKRSKAWKTRSRDRRKCWLDWLFWPTRERVESRTKHAIFEIRRRHFRFAITIVARAVLDRLQRVRYGHLAAIVATSCEAHSCLIPTRLFGITQPAAALLDLQATHYISSKERAFARDKYQVVGTRLGGLSRLRAIIQTASQTINEHESKKKGEDHQRMRRITKDQRLRSIIII
jgi:hypothetical protein